MMKRKNNKHLFLALIDFVLISTGCSYNGSTTINKFIARNYTLSECHASFDENDIGEGKYISGAEAVGGEVVPVYDYHCSFDEFNYYKSVADVEAGESTHNMGLSSFVNTKGKDSDNNYVTYFNFHYDGTCEYQITMADSSFISKSGTYTMKGDIINITYSDNTTAVAETRFGLLSQGFARDKITYMRVKINLPGLPDEYPNKDVYVWFYDGILHPDPWGDKNAK